MATTDEPAGELALANDDLLVTDQTTRQTWCSASYVDLVSRG